MKNALKTVLSEYYDEGLSEEDGRIKSIALDQLHLVGEWK